MSEVYRIVSATPLHRDPIIRGEELERLKLLIVEHTPGDFLLFTEDRDVAYRLRPH